MERNEDLGEEGHDLQKWRQRREKCRRKSDLKKEIEGKKLLWKRSKGVKNYCGRLKKMKRREVRRTLGE